MSVRWKQEHCFADPAAIRANSVVRVSEVR